MKYLKVYENWKGDHWESIEYRWVLFLKDGNGFIGVDRYDPILMDIRDFDKSQVSKGFQSEKSAIDFMNDIEEMEIYDNVEERNVEPEDLEIKKFFIGSYMVDENDDDLGI